MYGYSKYIYGFLEIYGYSINFYGLLKIYFRVLLSRICGHRCFSRTLHVIYIKIASLLIVDSSGECRGFLKLFSRGYSLAWSHEQFPEIFQSERVSDQQ